MVAMVWQETVMNQLGGVRVRVEPPPNAVPGGAFTIQTREGKKFQVRLPPTWKPGQPVTVTLPRSPGTGSPGSGNNAGTSSSDSSKGSTDSGEAKVKPSAKTKKSKKKSRYNSRVKLNEREIEREIVKDIEEEIEIDIESGFGR